jgi:polyhydroxyalkanoate synthase
MHNINATTNADFMSSYRMAASLIADKLTNGKLTMPFEYLKEAREILTGPLNTEIAATPYDVVYQEDRVKLKHYHRPHEMNGKSTPLLIVYAQINRETMLDLQPGRSVLDTFLSAGLDIYVIDWNYPSRKDRYLSIDDHVNGYMENIVNFILDRHGLAQVNIMGICQGGTFCVIYSALHPEKVKNLITTVTPTNFDTDSGLLNIWARSLDENKLVDTYGNFPGDLLNLGFLLLNPARLMIDKYVGLMENLTDQDFVENFVRMERWIFDSPDLPGETFREFIKYFYKENRLIKNELIIGGKRVNLKKITMPVLNIFAKHDHLVPPDASDRYIFETGSIDKENVCLNTGHIGIYVSSKMQSEFGPRIVKWLAARDDSQKPAARIN